MNLLQGSAAYAPEKEALVWKIRNFPGGKEFLLRAKFGLPSVAAEDEQTGRMPPIRVNYEVTASSPTARAFVLARDHVVISRHLDVCLAWHPRMPSEVVCALHADPILHRLRHPGV